jgi:hypothetical protein
MKKKTVDAIKEEIEDKQIQTQVQQPIRKEIEMRPIVMPQLPTKAYRKVIDESSGEVFEAMSYDEALTEILQTIREIKKAVI